MGKRFYTFLIPHSHSCLHYLMSLILVVEDELELAEIIEAYLRREGYQTERASNGKRALELYRSAKPDLVLLDVMMPKLNGIEVLKTIRQDGQTPVIMLTARAEDDDKLLGLELGSDDYIIKPFNPREVVARVKAVLRRSQQKLGVDVLRMGTLEIHKEQVQVFINTEPLELTPTEFRLLLCLAEAPGRVFNRLELLEVALPESEALERVVDAHLKNLRKKLEHVGAGDLIETVFGMGYRLVLRA
jgi:two-component system, OmpR family, response regulator AdeR